MQKDERKPRLSNRQIEFCLLHLLLVPELFEYAKQHIRPADFSQATEMPYAVLWDCALTASNANGGKLPEKVETVLGMELGSRLSRPHEFGLSSKDCEYLATLFEWVVNFDRSKLDGDYYRALAQDLIIERTVLGQMGRDISAYRDVGRPVDMLGSLAKYHQKLQGIMADAGTAGASAFPIDYKPQKLGKFSTGIKWFDRFMNGGQAPGEVYVLLGPTGVGKTSSGVNITVEAARVWNAAHANGAIPRKKVSCFFSWEQDMERLRHRFWSYAAQIDSSRLERYADETATLSTRGNLETYEIELFAHKIRDLGLENVDGEAERLRMASLELNETVRIFDFSGAADNPHIGTGGLDEVVTALRGVQKEGYDIGVVVLDYANAAVRKYIAARGEDPANLRLHLSNWCNECRFKIGIPFNCPVWALNQLNTEANRRAPTAEQHHSYASECGNFAENAWFAFLFGTKDKVNDACQLFCTKERRAKGDQPPAILKIRGNLCTMQDISDTHVSAPALRQLATKNIVQSRIDPGELRRRAEERRPGSSNLSDY